MLESEAFYPLVLDVNVGGEIENVILKDVQRHPQKAFPCMSISCALKPIKPIKVNVPLHFLNEEKCEGVKIGGGMIQHQATDIEDPMSCQKTFLSTSRSIWPM